MVVKQNHAVGGNPMTEADGVATKSCRFCGHRNLLVGLFAALAVSGCATIRETTRMDDREIRSVESKEVGEGITPEAKVSLVGSQSDGHIAVDVVGSKTCSTIKTTVVERTQVTERQQFFGKEDYADNMYRSIAPSVLRYVFGGLAAIVLGVGIGGYASVGNGSGPPPWWSGWLTIGGAVATAWLLPVAIVDSFRSIDRRDSLGEASVRTTLKAEPCEEKPYAGALVRLVKANARPEDIERSPATYVLGEERADESGSAHFSLSRLEARAKAQGWEQRGQEVVVEKVVAQVEGKNVAPVKALEPIYADWGKRWVRDAQEKQARKQDDAVRDEIATGRCTDERYANLQRGHQFFETVFQQMHGAGEMFDLVASDTIVATEKGADLKFDVGLGGEMHIFAFGLEPVTLEVRDRNGYPSANGSVYWVLFRDRGGSVDSRVVRANSRDRVSVKVKGGGCTLVMAFRKY